MRGPYIEIVVKEPDGGTATGLTFQAGVPMFTT